VLQIFMYLFSNNYLWPINVLIH